jgi:hypothetical protein
VPTENINKVPPSGHFILQNIFSVRLGDPRLLSGLAFTFVLVVMARKLHFKESQTSEIFDEELVPYQQALKKRTGEIMISTDRYYKKYYGLQVPIADEIAKIKVPGVDGVKTSKKQKIQGVSSYNILENPRY